MIRRLLCPDRARLQGLLDGDVPPAEKAELTGHLDVCPHCQETLEMLAGGTRLPRCSAGQPIVETALRHVMDGLKGLSDDPDPAADMPLDFLTPPDRPGLLGRLAIYDVTEVIGRGGMGVVLKAFDPGLHRNVAIKMLAPHLATSGAARRRFAREAQAAAAVSHEHVVAIHAVDATRSGLPYLVMQYVPGVSLQERLDKSGPLELAEILRIGYQSACGLAAAHAQGLVHRDVKPANILLENGIERVKLTDFGLARAVDDASLTQSGVLAGTPQYMAPEQSRGEGIDARCDLFSLGSVLYALCTGRPPFRASTTLAVLRRVSEETPRPIREINPAVPEWLVRIVARLHAKDPADRFQSAAEVAELLGRCLAHVQAPDREPLPHIPCPEPTEPPTRRPRGRWLTAAAVLLLCLAGLAAAEAAGADIVNWAATVLRLRTANGTLVITVDDPQAKVTLDGDEVLITGTGVKELRLKPGTYTVRATKDGTKPFEDIVTIRRGDKEIVKVTLEPAGTAAAADVLGGERKPTTAEVLIFDAIRGHSGRVGSVAFTPDGKRLATASDDGTVRLWDAATGKALDFVKKVAEAKILSVFLLPDGKTLLAVDETGKIRVYDLATGKQLWSMDLGIRFCTSSLSPDGRTLAAAGDRAAGFWEVETGRPGQPLPADTRAMAFSRDGRLLAVGSAASGTIRLWAVGSGQISQQAKDDGAGVLAVAFAPDGRQVVAAGTDGAVRAWGLDDLLGVRQLMVHKGAVNQVTFSPDSRWIASGGSDGLVRIQNADTGKELKPFRLPAGPVTSLAFSPDGRRLAIGSGDGSVWLWDDPSGGGQVRRLTARDESGGAEWLFRRHDTNADGLLNNDELPEALRGERDKWDANKDGFIDLSEFRAYLRSRAIRDVQLNDLSFHNLRHAAELVRCESCHVGMGLDKNVQKHIEALNAELQTARIREAVAADRLVAMQDQLEKQLYLHHLQLAERAWQAGNVQQVQGLLDKVPVAARGWEWHYLQSRPEPVVLRGNADAVYRVAFSPDGRRVASAGADQTVRVWDVKTREQVLDPLKPGGKVRALAYGPDNRRLAAAGEEGTVHVYDTETGKAAIVLKTAHPVNALAYSPGGERLVGGGKGLFQIWDMTNGQALRGGGSPGLDVRAVAVSPDGQWIATGEGNRWVRVVDRDLSRSARILDNHSGPVRAVACSPNSKLLAVADDRRVVVYDAATAGQIGALAGHQAEVTSLAYSPDGKRLATASADGTVRLWDPASGQQVLVLKGHAGPVNSVAFSPDGRLLVSGGEDKSVRLWGVTVPATARP